MSAGGRRSESLGVAEESRLMHEGELGCFSIYVQTIT